MNAFLDKFISETREGHGTDSVDWRSTFFPRYSDRDWLDVAVVAGTSVADILTDVRSGAYEDKRIPPKVLEAFNLQFPNVEDFREFIQSHDSPEQLRGIFSGIKGKLFELYHVEYLNDGHLPDGLVARLAESATQPGYDIVIEDAHQHPSEYLQDKATSSLALLREAIERYPEVDVYVPHGSVDFEHAQDLLHHVYETSIDGDAIGHQVDAGIEAAGHAVEYHFPWIGEIVVVGTELNRWRKGNSSFREFRKYVWRRTSRLFGSNAVGQLVAIGAGTPYLQLISIPTRLMISRWDVSNEFEKRSEQRRARIVQVSEAFEAGDGERVRLLTTPLLLFAKEPSPQS